MNGTELFDKLLEDRKITLVITVSQAASLRVSFTRKFKDYKQQMLALGFLDPDLEDAVVSLEYDKESNKAKFFLREKKRVAIDYTIVEDTSQ
jgi:hypothetical protein